MININISSSIFRYMFEKLAEWLTKNTFFIFQYITTDDTILNKHFINEKMREHCIKRNITLWNNK